METFLQMAAQLLGELQVLVQFLDGVLLGLDIVFNVLMDKEISVVDKSLIKSELGCFFSTGQAKLLVRFMRCITMYAMIDVKLNVRRE